MTGSFDTAELYALAGFGVAMLWTGMNLGDFARKLGEEYERHSSAAKNSSGPAGNRKDAAPVSGSATDKRRTSSAKAEPHSVSDQPQDHPLKGEECVWQRDIKGEDAADHGKDDACKFHGLTVSTTGGESTPC